VYQRKNKKALIGQYFLQRGCQEPMGWSESRSKPTKEKN
jgi:hypothetical protein